MRSLLLTILLVSSLIIHGQTNIQLDSVLMNERTMDRPITTHKGQLRLNMDYSFSAINSRFDSEGDKIKLSDQGQAGIQNNLMVEVEYGILEFLEISALLDYKSSVLREQGINILTLDPVTFAPYPPINVNETRYQYGLKDIFLNLDFRVPLKSEKIDLVFSGGFTIPSGPTEPDQPEFYVFNLVQDGFTESTEFESYYYDRPGTGVLTSVLGGKFKYRFNDLAISAYFDYKFPQAISESAEWRVFYTGGVDFQYQTVPYNFLPPEIYNGRFEIEYQLYPFINLFFDYNLYGTLGGWSELTGKRVSYRNLQLHRVSPGLEIILTSKFWLRQQFNISVNGQNSFAPASFQTRLIYNLSVLK